ncbi:PEBP family protein [Marinovum sp.]|uniref:PEBP family protein n=1 Tax=Marinovum sp. TaxID=2024839 RepID=UPI002B26BABF|nr:PEBP family protein [Marinovum sp.]
MSRSLVAAALLPILAAPLAAETLEADVWADNWFEMRIDGRKVAEDSVPITTERSFKAESFTFDADRPFVIGVIAMDYKANDTGLEYIGTDRQQMGDGGLIVQIRDAEGDVVAVSDEGWQCLTIHTAPLDTACADEDAPLAGSEACGFKVVEEPVGWDHVGFDASGWQPASTYSEAEVRPKEGYDEIDWDARAKLIWGPDLQQSNTVLCRLSVE